MKDAGSTHPIDTNLVTSSLYKNNYQNGCFHVALPSQLKAIAQRWEEHLGLPQGEEEEEETQEKDSGDTNSDNGEEVRPLSKRTPEELAKLKEERNILVWKFGINI